MLEIAVPAGSQHDLLGAFLNQWPSYLAYVVSFSTIGALNLLLLLVVSFLPFPTRLLAEYLNSDNAERVAVSIYGLTLLVALSLLSVLWRYGVRAHLARTDMTDDELTALTRRLTPGLAGYVVLLGFGLFKPTVAVMVEDRGPGSSYNIPFSSGDHIDVDVALVTAGLDRSDCTLTLKVDPDKPGEKETSVRLQPKALQSVSLIDGLHTFIASCPSSAGTLTSRIGIQATDGRPEKCLGFDFAASEITASSLEELADGMLGTWTGCVTTPWTPVYWATITFRSDGTYSAHSGETLDGRKMVALYYGDDTDSPRDIYALDDFQATRKGVGTMDLDSGISVNHDELRRIALMGDDLQFEFWHRGYGPVTFRLKRS